MDYSDLGELLGEIGNFDFGGDMNFNYNWKNEFGNSLLHFAAYGGRVSDVECLVENGADVNSTNNFLETPLHRAAIGRVMECRLEIIKTLIDNGADPYAKDKDGDTFLHIFIGQEETPLTPSLLQSLVNFPFGGDFLFDLFNTPGGESEVTPLHLTVEYLEPEDVTLEQLEANGVDFKKLDKYGDSILAHAVWGGRGKEFLSKLIIRFRALHGHLNKKKESMLHIAVKAGYLEGVKFFLGLGGGGLLDVNGKDASGFTPLHVAVNLDLKENGQPLRTIIDVCDLLCRYRADPNSEANLQETPLHLAAVGRDKKASLEVVKFLIEKGADAYPRGSSLTFLHRYVLQGETPTPSQFHSMAECLIGNGHPGLFNSRRGPDEYTPLQVALQKIEVEERTLTLLYKSKVNFNEVDKYGGSLLVYAINGKRSLALVSALVNRFHVNWRAVSSNGDSLLHYAAQFGTVESFKFVLDLGGWNPNGGDNDGDTPLHCAIIGHAGDTEILLQKCKLLVKNGARVDKRNSVGETPFKTMRGEMHTNMDADERELMEILKPNRKRKC